jgi:hypothetical protein
MALRIEPSSASRRQLESFSDYTTEQRIKKVIAVALTFFGSVLSFAFFPTILAIAASTFFIICTYKYIPKRDETPKPSFSGYRSSPTPLTPFRSPFRRFFSRLPPIPEEEQLSGENGASSQLRQPRAQAVAPPNLRSLRASWRAYPRTSFITGNHAPVGTGTITPLPPSPSIPRPIIPRHAQVGRR